MAAGVDFYLHSNMDRFEIFRFRLLLRFSYIYIPIWIDLKVTEDCGDGCVYVIYIPIWIDLKAGHTATVDALKEIYIPIWIDLKGAADRRCRAPEAIYIPIWIDLKAILPAFVLLLFVFTFQYG